MQENNDLVSVSINDNKLIITVGVEALDTILFRPCSQWQITDINTFAKDLVTELTSEDEEGTTLVHQMLDTAANNAFENGSAGMIDIDEG